MVNNVIHKSSSKFNYCNKVSEIEEKWYHICDITAILGAVSSEI